MTPHHALLLARRPRRSRLWLALMLPLCLACGVSAQIKPDGSLGSALPLVGPAYVIPQSIGRLAGGNLFHSFEAFNILGGQSANFTVSTSNLANVISRVTGGTSSAINGQLKLSADIGTPNVVLGTPNFFFINPAGITFGAGASIDVPGAFHVSTANYIKFADGNFHADLGQTSTFSSAVPEAFGFLGGAMPAKVRFTGIDGSTPLMPQGGVLNVVAGAIEVASSNITIPSGTVRLVSVGTQPATIGVDTAPGSATAGPLTISNSNIDVTGSDGGHITVRAGPTVIEGSTLYAISFDGNPGSITMNATNLTVDGSELATATFGSGNAGDVSIDVSGAMSVLNGGRVSSYTFDTGDGGQVKVKAGTLTVSGSDSGLNLSTISTEAHWSGKAGDVSIDVSGAMSVLQGGEVSSSSNWDGAGGNVVVKAGTLTVSGSDIGFSPSSILTAAHAFGNAGDVAIDVSGALSVLNGGQVGSFTVGTGDGGNVKVKAGTLTVSGNDGVANISAISTATGFAGKAGDVSVEVGGDMSVVNGGRLTSVTVWEGDAGNVNVVVKGGTLAVEGPGSAITTRTTGVSGGFATAGPGKAGDISIDVSGDMLVLNGGEVSSATSAPFGVGDSGRVNVTVKGGALVVAGTDWAFNPSTIHTETSSSGKAGDVSFDVTGAMYVLDGGRVASTTNWRGAGGNVSVVVKGDGLLIDGSGSTIETTTTGVSGFSATSRPGRAGDVSIDVTGEMFVLNGGGVTSFTSAPFGKADSGRVDVVVRGGSLTVSGSSSDFSPSVIGTLTQSSGRAGDVSLDVGGAVSVLNGGSLLSASFASGDGGNLSVKAESLTASGSDGFNFSTIGAITLFSGKAGDVLLDVKGAMSVLDGASVVSQAMGDGNGGRMAVKAGALTVSGADSVFNRSVISTSTDASGTAGDLSIDVTGEMKLSNFGSVGSASFGSGNAGGLTIRAGTLAVTDEAIIGSFIHPGATGNAGALSITVDAGMSLLNGGQVSSATAGKGNAGSLTVTARDLTIAGHGSVEAAKSGLFTIAAPGSTGDAGTLSVMVSGDMNVLNGGEVRSTTQGTGIAGGLSVTAGNLKVSGSSQVSSSASPGSSGNAADMAITVSGQLSLLDGGQMGSATTGLGDGGSVTVITRELTIDSQGNTRGTGLFAQAREGSSGNAGNLSVTVSDEMRLLDFATVTTSTKGKGDAGSVGITAGKLSVQDRAEISSAADAGSSGNAGTVSVAVSGEMSVLNGGRVSSATFDQGNGGSVTVTAGSLTLDGRAHPLGAGLAASAQPGSSGNAGNVTVNVSGEMSVLNGGQVSSSTFGEGHGGSVDVTAGKLTIGGQGHPTASGTGLFAQTQSSGHAGNVAVRVSGEMSLFETGQVSSSSFDKGNGGSVTVTAGNLTIDAQGILRELGTGLFATAGSSGNAGSISVDVSDEIRVLGFGSVNSSTTGTGHAGSIRINAGKLSVQNAGQISSAALPGSSGDGGSVSVTAGSLTIDGQGNPIAPTGLFAAAAPGSSGNAGNIEVATTGNLSVTSGGSISSDTSASGRAGAVTVSAGTLLVDGASSSINASAQAGSSGQTGNVTIAATRSITLSNGGSLSIQNEATAADASTIVPTTLSVSAPDITLKDASITAASNGNVAASDIQISFTGHLFLDPSSITTSAYLGNGGSISIFGGRLVTLENSRITTSVQGQSGNGGDIVLNAYTLILETGFIQANTVATNASGGLVAINVQNLLASGNSLFTGGDVPYLFQPGVFGFNVIQAAAPTGLSGLVQITTPLLDVSGSLSGLSAQVIDTGGLARNPCQVTGGSSLAQSGRGGLPPSARGLLRSDPGFATMQSAQPPAIETHARAGLATAGCL